MTFSDACRILGVDAGESDAEVRAKFHALMRQHHPDVVAHRPSDSYNERDPALLTEAYALVVDSLRESTDGRVPNAVPVPVATATPRPQTTVASGHDGDTIWIEAPPDEAYQRLLDAAAFLGGIGHVDRNLGLLEVIVRFEGGPSCSVLMTLQGRAHGTDVFCEMESIEAEPAPAILPVLDALVEQLQRAD